MGWFIIAAYAGLAVALWPWGLLAGAAHVAVLLACVPRTPRPDDPLPPTKQPCRADCQLGRAAPTHCTEAKPPTHRLHLTRPYSDP